MPCFENFISVCLEYFFFLLFLVNQILQVLRYKQPVFFLIQTQIGLEQQILPNLLIWALLIKQDGVLYQQENTSFLGFLDATPTPSKFLMATGFFKVVRPAAFIFFKKFFFPCHTAFSVCSLATAFRNPVVLAELSV